MAELLLLKEEEEEEEGEEEGRRSRETRTTSRKGRQHLEGRKEYRQVTIVSLHT